MKLKYGFEEKEFDKELDEIILGGLELEPKKLTKAQIEDLIPFDDDSCKNIKVGDWIAIAKTPPLYVMKDGKIGDLVKVVDIDEDGWPLHKCTIGESPNGYRYCNYAPVPEVDEPKKLNPEKTLEIKALDKRLEMALKKFKRSGKKPKSKSYVQGEAKSDKK